MNRLGIATLALALLAACSRNEADVPDPTPQTVCTMEARSALAVTVVDDATGARVQGATVRVTNGSYAENLVGFEGVYSGAHERPGTYTIVVSHPDYRQWQRAGVVVERDECHVVTEAVEARLVRR